MKKTNPMNDATAEYFWCLHCEMVYLAEDWDAANWTCPRVECDGSTGDACPWVEDDFPRVINLGYPEVPVLGVKYPLYSGSKGVRKPLCRIVGKVKPEYF